MSCSSVYAWFIPSSEKLGMLRAICTVPTQYKDKLFFTFLRKVIKFWWGGTLIITKARTAWRSSYSKSRPLWQLSWVHHIMQNNIHQLNFKATTILCWLRDFRHQGNNFQFKKGFLVIMISLTSHNTEQIKLPTWRFNLVSLLVHLFYFNCESD